MNVSKVSENNPISLDELVSKWQLLSMEERKEDLKANLNALGAQTFYETYGKINEDLDTFMKFYEKQAVAEKEINAEISAPVSQVEIALSELKKARNSRLEEDEELSKKIDAKYKEIKSNNSVFANEINACEDRIAQLKEEIESSEKYIADTSLEIPKLHASCEKAEEEKIEKEKHAIELTNKLEAVRKRNAELETFRHNLKNIDESSKMRLFPALMQAYAQDDKTFEKCSKEAKQVLVVNEKKTKDLRAELSNATTKLAEVEKEYQDLLKAKNSKKSTSSSQAKSKLSQTSGGFKKPLPKSEAIGKALITRSRRERFTKTTPTPSQASSAASGSHASSSTTKTTYVNDFSKIQVVKKKQKVETRNSRNSQEQKRPLSSKSTDSGSHASASTTKTIYVNDFSEIPTVKKKQKIETRNSRNSQEQKRPLSSKSTDSGSHASASTTKTIYVNDFSEIPTVKKKPKMETRNSKNTKEQKNSSRSK